MTRIFQIMILIFLIFVYSVGYSQTQFIPLFADAAIFLDQNNAPYAEIYVSFFSKNLQYVDQGDFLQADVTIQVFLKKNDKKYAEQSRNFSSKILKTSQVRVNNQFVTQFRFPVEPGEYIANVKVTDIHSQKTGNYEFHFSSPQPEPGVLTLSDIELSSKISRTQANPEFNKSVLNVIPNPSTIYSVTLPMLYYYAEAYNFKFDPNQKGHYLVKSYITDASGTVIKDLGERSHEKPGTSAVIFGGKNIITLDPGVYFLNIEVTDMESKTMSKAIKRFTLVKPQKKTIFTLKNEKKSQNKYLAEYGAFSEAELDKEFEMAKYIATRQEIQVYKNLPVEEKKKFLAQFWYKRDKKFKNPNKTFKRDYFERIQYANQFFSTANKEGWQTDRGRNLLKYGRPDDIEYNKMSVDKKPYEIWYYHHLEGGVIFVFADLTGFGDYELIHSTATGEVKDPNWQSLLDE